MKIKHYFFLLIFIVSLLNPGYGQDLPNLDLRKDSLDHLYQQADQDTIRVKLLLDMGDLYEFENPDTSIFFYNTAFKVADHALRSSNKARSQTIISLAKLKSNSLRYIGIIYAEKGEYEKAMEYYQSSLEIFQILAALHIVDGEKGISACYINIGVVYQSQGIYDKALEYYLRSLKIAEKYNDIKIIKDCYTNIGLLHSEQGNYEKALEYSFKSLEIAKKLVFLDPIGGKNAMSQSFNNIGIVYDQLGNPEKAVEYYEKSLKINMELGNKMGMSQCINNIGTIEAISGNYNKAMKSFYECLKIDLELDDKNSIALDYGNLAELHLLLADSSLGTKRTHHLYEALQFGLKAITIAEEINAVPWINTAAKTLKNTYKELGNFKKAIEYADIFISTRDTMFNEEKTQSLADAESKFKAEKKQLEIDKLSREKELQQSELLREQETGRRQKLMIIFIIVVLVLIAVFAVLVVQRLRITSRQKRIIEKQKSIVDQKNTLLHQQNEEIKNQRDEIEAQRDEIEAQRDMVTAQKDHIEKQKKEITDSINYAKRIQQAVLPSIETIENILGEQFILFKPKAIVSGDFYWVTKIKEFQVVTVADCTGHGVPGAFMSMLGVTFLNEIVRKKEITNAGEILDNLRDSVIQALQQKGTHLEQKDGMDIAICVLNTYDKTLQFAGAFNPLYIISKNEKTKQVLSAIVNPYEMQHDEAVLFEIKPDKQPVAIHSFMNTFSTQNFPLQKNDILYLMSDGYEDQFGGPKRKKFLSRQLKEVLLENCDRTMEEQKMVLEKIFEDWKGNINQIDDVTILGFKIQ